MRLLLVGVGSSTLGGSLGGGEAATGGGGVGGGGGGGLITGGGGGVGGGLFTAVGGVTGGGVGGGGLAGAASLLTLLLLPPHMISTLAWLVQQSPVSTHDASQQHSSDFSEGSSGNFGFSTHRPQDASTPHVYPVTCAEM